MFMVSQTFVQMQNYMFVMTKAPTLNHVSSWSVMWISKSQLHQYWAVSVRGYQLTISGVEASLMDISNNENTRPNVQGCDATAWNVSGVYKT